MPSMAESKRQVREGLAAGPDHDAILASLQDEIDRHNRIKEDTVREHKHRRRGDDSEKYQDRRERDLKFRFKSGVKDPKRKRSRHDDSSRSHHRHSKRHQPSSQPGETTAAHPFPREPSDSAPPSDPNASSNQAAFQASLFDALADDEAAAYWESVYSQPIHTYPRPQTEKPSGELETMTDEEYAAYVQRRMWEKAHPEVVWEKEEKERKKREDAEAKEARRQEFVRQRQREAWRRAGRAREDGDEDGEGYEYTFDFESGPTWSGKDKSRKREKEDQAWQAAWTAYLRAWDELKQSFTNSSTSEEPSAALPPSQRITWPVLPGKPATRPNIEAFMQHMPVSEGKTRLQLLKVERVRWHPDKIQHRFGGSVDEGTMKVVTGVFQVVDSMVEEERKKE